MLKDLLLQVLTVLLPILVIQAFMLHKYKFRHSTKRKILTGLLYGMSSILCMMFPVYLEAGIILDFRSIPLIIAILYEGYLAGGIGVAMAVGFRMFLGGNAVWFAFILNVLFFSVPFALVKRFCERNKVGRTMVCVGLSFLNYAFVAANLGLFYSFIERPHVFASYLPFIGLAGLAQIAIMSFSVYLVENAIEVSRIREEMLKTEKLTVVSELAASVAHEIRNPLTVVRGFLQLALSSSNLKVKKYLETSIVELDRAESIINEYLSLAKPQADRLEQVEASEKLHHVAALMNSLAAMKNVKMEAHIQDELTFRGDPVKFQQAIINVVKNAIEATAEGGCVLLKASHEQEELRIEVDDTGEGMTPEQLRKLGEPFYSTKAKGTGLGLAVAFRIVEAMGGTLCFESAKNKGTKATIRLPAGSR